MKTSSTLAIQTDGLTKRYGEISALAGLTLSVPHGVIYGFLGPNGAGKTTTIRMLLGFIQPTAGSAQVLGHDAWHDGVRARRDLGFLVVAEALYPDMSGNAQLDYTAKLSGKPPVLRRRLLDALELSDADLKRKLNGYSKGMKQKLALIAAIQHEPSLLVLDEPTDGLDPLIQRSFESVLREQAASGHTIFMSSHDLSEVERTCERVAVVRGGRLVAEETVADLIRGFRRHAHITFAATPPDGLDRTPGISVVSAIGHTVEIALEGDINLLLRFLATHDVADLVLSTPRLEDIFMGFYDTHLPDPTPARQALPS